MQTLYVSKRFLNWIRCFTGSQCKLLRAQLVNEKRGSLQIIWIMVILTHWRRSGKTIKILDRYTGQKWVTLIKSASNYKAFWSRTPKLEGYKTNHLSFTLFFLWFTERTFLIHKSYICMYVYKICKAPWLCLT